MRRNERQGGAGPLHAIAASKRAPGGAPATPSRGVAIVAAVLAAAAGGCHHEGDGHHHAAPPRAAEHRVDEPSGHADEVRLTAAAVSRHGVTVETAQRRRLQPLLSVPARLAFNTETMAHVGSPLRGRVVDVKVRMGDVVRAGQELVVVESPELGEAQGEYFQKRTAQETARPAVEIARVAWERAKGLLERSQGVSLTEVQRREAEHKSAVAAVKAADAAVLGAQNRLKILGMTDDAIASLADSGVVAPRFTIRAAVDGQVVEREVTLGELVGPDREYLMVLADPRRLWVLADVPEARLLQVAPEAAAWVKTGGVVPLRIEGKVSFVSPSVDPATRSAQVRIDLDASGNHLRPGMFAQVDIAVSDPSGASIEPRVAVPEEAIQTVGGGPAVFVPVAGEPNVFARRAVRVAAPVGGLVPIVAGLAEGEEFVSAGSFILKAELGKAGAEHSH